MKHQRLLLRSLVCVALSLSPIVGALSAQRTRTAGPPAGSRTRTFHPPEISTDLPAGAAVFRGQELRFTVTVSDPDGDPVSLMLLNPPAGLVFKPVHRAPSPSVSEVRWLVPATGYASSGRQELVFRAPDAAQAAIGARLAVPVMVLSDQYSDLVTGDVTGDGVLDVVGGAPFADVGGVQNAGSIYVWAGATVPAGAPSATLTVPGAVSDDELGGLEGDIPSPVAHLQRQGIQLGDVTGDGILDVVVGASGADVGGVPDAGAIYVFAGGPGLHGSKSPKATLTVPGAGWHNGLGLGGIQLGDLTGDGILDVVAGAPLADSPIWDAGVIYVFAGGPGLSGAESPSATLTVPGAAVQDYLGFMGEWGIQLVDVTGDGVFDVVAGASYAGGDSNTGAIYVFAGGAGLAGQVNPRATLTVPGAITGAHLGLMWLADVTGDRVLDVVCADRSEAYVFAGGAGLAGPMSPSATLTVPGQVWEAGLLLADVTDDGVLDVLAGGWSGPQPPAVTAIYVFAGGAGLSGQVNPGATLPVPYLTLRAIQLADVTDDGALDIVAIAPNASVGGVSRTGAIYVLAGGTGLMGSEAPSATLTVSGAAAQDRLGEGPPGVVQLADVTGDGALDIVAGAIYADVGGVLDTGAIYVFAGGAGLSGQVSPGATLTVPGAVPRERLGVLATRLAEVTDDGALDIVAGAMEATVSGVPGAGAVYVFAGGAGLSGQVSPDATLTVPGAAYLDLLGGIDYSYAYSSGPSPAPSSEGIQLAEVTGDGALDIVVTAPFEDAGGVTDGGAVHVFAGGAALSGQVSPSATLTVPGAAPGDLLGSIKGQGVQLVDVTGDGMLDVVAGASQADIGGVSDTGAIYLFTGGAALSGSVSPEVDMTVPGAVAEDHLGGGPY